MESFLRRQDLVVFLLNKDLVELQNKITLVSSLKDYNFGKDLGRKVSLSFFKNKSEGFYDFRGKDKSIELVLGKNDLDYLKNSSVGFYFSRDKLVSIYSEWYKHFEILYGYACKTSQ